MIVPSIPQVLLLMFLGGTFVHFTYAGARTFHSENLAFERGAAIGQNLFIFGGVMPAWYLGLHHVIRGPYGVGAAVLMAASLGLYEWARYAIRGRRFGLGWGEQVPEAVCGTGPYRLVRHPIYLSYVLAFLAVLVALPHWITGIIFALAFALFLHGARHDERQISRSALAADYAAYRERTGMFLPKLSRAAPGR